MGSAHRGEVCQQWRKKRSNRYRELWDNALGSTKQEREAFYLRYLQKNTNKI